MWLIYGDTYTAAVRDKAFDFIGGMNTSEPVPQSMDESTAEGNSQIFKRTGRTRYALDGIAARDPTAEDWSAGLPNKVAEWVNGSPPRPRTALVG